MLPKALYVFPPQDHFISKCDILTLADWTLSNMWWYNDADIVKAVLAHTCIVAQSVDAHRVRRTQSVLG